MRKSVDCVADSLNIGTVDLWRLPIEPADDYAALLSPEETLRAQRFHFARDRNRFTFVRGSLRLILGEYLGLDPARLEFRYAKNGKPYVAGSLNPFGLRFNVSHSGGQALIAVAWNRELGVDIEQIRPEVDIREVAAHFFSEREVVEIFDLPPEQHYAAFFNCWTRKEAYVKATGEGLSLPLRSFGVSVRPGEPARFTFVDGDPGEWRRWAIHDVSRTPCHPAALAIEGAGEEVCICEKALG